MGVINKAKVFLPVLIAILIFHTLFEKESIPSTFSIISDSMVPTLQQGDRVYVEDTNAVQRGDIVLFKYEKNYAVKRIAAIPGDIIEIQNKIVTLNGQRIERREIFSVEKSFLNNDQRYKGHTFKFYRTLNKELNHELMEGPDQSLYNKRVLPTKIPEKKYFLLGDGRDFSYDSREKEFGLIHENQILGKVLFIYFAENLKRIGKIYKQ
jgi:signal peptidase I